MDPDFNRNNTRPTFFLILAITSVITLGIGLRLYDLTDQPIDFHSTRQLRGAVIARGMYYEMLPSVDETTRKQAIAFWSSTGQLEPSILERLVAITYLILGKEVFWVARVYNSIFWIIGGIFIFDLSRRMVENPSSKGDETEARVVSYGSALVALGYYLVLPFSVQASRSFQPDPGMVMWIVLSAYAIYRWSESTEWSDGGEWKWALLSGLFSGMAVLTKAVALYTVAAIALSMVVYTFVFLRSKTLITSFIRILRSPQVWSIVLLMIVPTFVYYLGRDGRASDLFSNWTLALSHLLLAPSTYLRWLNLVQELTTWVALILSLVGIILAKQRNRALLLGLWLGYLSYGLLLPYQMYTHTYYHLQLIPIVALSLTPVVKVVLKRVNQMRKVWRLSFVAALFVLLLYSSWQALIPLYSQDYRNEPAYWQEIASFLPSDGKIIALTQDYGYRLMYYGWRKVSLWPNRGEINLGNLRNSDKEFLDYFIERTEGKSYFLVTAFRQFDDQPALQQTLYENFKVLAEGQGYIIFDLTKPQSNN